MRTVVFVGALLACAAAPDARVSSTPADALVERSYELTYNLDFDDALKALGDAAANPNAASVQRAVATCTWLQILFNRGAVTVDDYMGRVSASDTAMEQVPSGLASRFRASAERALALGEAAVRRSPGSAAAHYDLGAAVGLVAAYSATVEGRMMRGLRAARRAFNEQERVLALDPARKDAGLIVGTYRYIVAGLPLPIRLMAYAAGFGGGRERGIRMIEEAAAYPGESQADAKFALLLVYNRERRFDRALAVARELQARFPRNRLLWLEAGATALRAGRAAEAERELTEGIRRLAADTRPRSFGEEAMWRYKRGLARALTGNRAGAHDDLRMAVSLKGRAWVTGRAHTELGKLADLAGDRAAARREYQAAVSFGRNGRDPRGVDEATALLSKPYTQR